MPTLSGRARAAATRSADMPPRPRHHMTTAAPTPSDAVVAATARSEGSCIILPLCTFRGASLRRMRAVRVWVHARARRVHAATRVRRNVLGRGAAHVRTKRVSTMRLVYALPQMREHHLAARDARTALALSGARPGECAHALWRRVLLRLDGVRRLGMPRQKLSLA